MPLSKQARQALIGPAVVGALFGAFAAFAESANLNERHIPSPSGGRWWGETVMRMGQRLGLRHPLAAAHRRVPFKNRGAYLGHARGAIHADGAPTLSGRVAVANVRRQLTTQIPAPPIADVGERQERVIIRLLGHSPAADCPASTSQSVALISLRRM